jgi:hypothetical protein
MTSLASSIGELMTASPVLSSSDGQQQIALPSFSLGQKESHGDRPPALLRDCRQARATRRPQRTDVWKRRDEYVAIAERDRWRIGANRHAAPTEARPDLRARSPARRSAGERDAVGGTATNTQST